MHEKKWRMDNNRKKFEGNRVQCLLYFEEKTPVYLWITEMFLFVFSFVLVVVCYKELDCY